MTEIDDEEEYEIINGVKIITLKSDFSYKEQEKVHQIYNQVKQYFLMHCGTEYILEEPINPHTLNERKNDFHVSKTLNLPGKDCKYNNKETSCDYYVLKIIVSKIIVIK